MGNELRKDTKTGFDSPPPTFSVRFYAPGLKSPSKFLRLFLGKCVRRQPRKNIKRNGICDKTELELTDVQGARSREQVTRHGHLCRQRI